MTRYIFNVPDMSCQHCVNRISKALEDLGLKDFSVDLEAKRVTVETDDPAQVISAVDDAGYPAEEEK
jgi:copper chaperone